MNLASYIDHTLLKPDCTLDAIKQLCEEAKEYGFSAVCVPPYFVGQAKSALKGTKVKTATVIGFPMGYAATQAKVEEIKRAISDGADELDVVVNICAIKSKNWNYVQNDIDSMTTAVHLKGKVIKVIFETGLLTDDEIKQLCKICDRIKPNFVKTSTGFLGEGATVEKIELLRSKLDPEIKIKASGGIRKSGAAKKLIEAGASRLGSSSGVDIVTKNN